MAQNRHFVLLLAFIGCDSFAATGDQDSIQFSCKDRSPGYVQRTALPMPDLTNLNLQGDKDSSFTTAESKTNYLEQDDSTGHSRLGERFLARLFGYKGNFSDGSEVDDWIAQQDISSSRNRGIASLWKKWKSDSPLLLTVTDYNTNKNLYDPKRLFQNSSEEMNFVKCVERDIAELKCANMSGHSMQENALVYYSSDPDAQVFCEVRSNPSGPTVADQQLAAVIADTTASVGGGTNKPAAKANISIPAPTKSTAGGK